ncbi:Polymorphic membrane protein Chlamydia [Methanobacterium lacus]|uniref:Polymorphic membrane protein Chlamydia n=1 Tax=Methanobacterium lacus (strain AL-21) TaxID=877455 RepID=F0T989_METLA|nr:hypothetical protein [Methanobacterium lacus]ADZ09840.1 Polymorphic membrane protein Chlamydia [Methanobacterium lacus]
MKNLKVVFIPLIILIILGTASASQATNASQTVNNGGKLVQSSNPTSNDLSVYYVDMKGNDNNTGKNLKQAFKTIQKAINVGSGNFCVVVAKGVYFENLVINKNVKLIGNSSKNTVINGNNKSSCVWIKNSGDVQIDGLTFTNGKSSLGGGIRNQGTLTLKYSCVTSNRANDGGGIYNEGTVNIRGSSISNNSCNYNGGGIQNLNTAYIMRTNILSNTAEMGGGINSKGELQLYQSRVSNNKAEIGGGINNDHCVISTVSSYINGNKAIEGGGIYNNNGIFDIFVTQINSNVASYGGGISNYGLINLHFSTVTKNYASIKGGGIYNYSSIFKDISTTITNNTIDNVNLNPVHNFPVNQ